MSDAIALAEASIDRLLQRSEQHDRTWADLQSAGMFDVLLADEQPFETAAALVKVAGRHAADLPLAGPIIATWLADLGGLTGVPKTAGFALPGTPPTGWLQRKDGRLVAGGILRGASTGPGGLVTVLPIDGVPWVVHVAAEHADSAARNLADQPRTSIALDGMTIAEGRAAPLPAAASTPLVVAAFLTAAQMLGAMETCLALSTRYAGERQQFGRPIAQFQAVQHLCARIAVGVATVRVAVAQAARSLDRGSGLLAVAIAKSKASEIAEEIAAAAHQIHGAIGFTEEYPLGTFTRRLWSWRDEFGDEGFWNGVVGTAAIGWSGELWSHLVDGTPGTDEDLRRVLDQADLIP
jgi:acyl-CoA dehydrogenase